MQVANQTDQETQELIDAGTAEISTELFGQDDSAKAPEPGLSEGGAESTDAPPAKEPAETKAPEGAPETTPTPDENSAEVQATGAPKTWTKDALEDWAKIPARAQQEILKREEDFYRGIGQYKQAAEVGLAYDKVVEPYRGALAAANINPIDLFSSFSANHYLLSQGTPEQKIELAANLLDSYQIPLEPLLQLIADRGLSEPTNPRIAALENEIAQLRGGFDNRTRQETEQARFAISSSLNAFADDGQHPYFDEVAEDIARLVESGQAANLQEAYDKAIYLNPTTRQREIDRIASERLVAAKTAEQTKVEQRRKSMGDHVTTTPTSRDGTVPKGSMDDTLDETMREITSRE